MLLEVLEDPLRFRFDYVGEDVCSRFGEPLNFLQGLHWSCSSTSVIHSDGPHPDPLFSPVRVFTHSPAHLGRGSRCITARIGDLYHVPVTRTYRRWTQRSFATTYGCEMAVEIVPGRADVQSRNLRAEVCRPARYA